MIRTLPRDFVLGATTAAYQVEGGTAAGGRVPSSWDSWYHRAGAEFNADTASDFYTHYRDDIRRCAKFNIRTLAISLSWSRIIKDEQGTVNDAGIKFYSDVIDECLASGIEPFVALYHFDTPEFIFAQGEWLSPRTVEQFLRYARVCFTAFGDRVKHWLTLKDPVTQIVSQYVTGLFPPCEQFELAKATQALHKMLVAHARTVNLYHSLGLPGKIGIAHRAEAIYPVADNPDNERAAEIEDVFRNRLLLDAVLDGGYSRHTLAVVNGVLAREDDSFAPAAEELHQLRDAADALGFLGVNYYSSHFVEAYDGEDSVHHNGAGERGTGRYALRGVGRRLSREGVPTTDWDWSIFPHGLYDMLLRISEEYPPVPIYITENGLGLKEQLPPAREGHERMVEDDDRIDYIRQHLAAVLDAIDEGVDIRGYFVWSMLDAMSWTNGYKKRYGLFYVDYETQERHPKKSAYWLADLAKKRIMLTVDGLGSWGLPGAESAFH